jgi:hypothetical protein
MSSSTIVGSLASQIPSPARSVGSPEEQCDTTPMEPPKAEPALEMFDLKLLTIIKPGSDIRITCPCSIRIEILEGQYCYCHACTSKYPALPHCNISASTSIRLFAETWTRISPTEPLNEAFAKGWEKIPDNLKYKILQVNLKADMLIGSESRCCVGDFEAGCVLRHHIALGPEFATLAARVFYETNTFSFISERVPPRAARHHIRHAVVRVVCPLEYGWQEVGLLASAAGGFTNLEHIRIEFETASIEDDLFMMEEDGRMFSLSRIIQFDCQGELEFGYVSCAHRSAELRQNSALQNVESIAKKLIRFL